MVTLKAIGILGVGVWSRGCAPTLFLYAHMLGAVLSAFHAACGYSYRLGVVRASTGLLGGLMWV